VRGRGAALEGVFEQRAFLARVASMFDAIDRAYIERVAGDGEPSEIEGVVAERVRARLGLG